MKKKVIIISYSYLPSNAPAAKRPYSLAKYLDKEAYDITVITCTNADSSLGFDTNFDPELKGVTLIKVNALLGKQGSILRENKGASEVKMLSFIKRNTLKIINKLLIFDKAIFWYPRMKRFIKKNRQLFHQADVVISTSPLFTNHIVAKLIKKEYPAIRWIVDIRDFHYVSNIEKTKGIQVGVNKRAEERIIKNSDALTFTTQRIKEAYALSYPEAKHKMSVIFNDLEFDIVESAETSLISNKKLTVFYAGSFYGNRRSPIPLLSLFDSALKDKVIEKKDFEIQIAGTIDAKVVNRLKKFNSFDNIIFLGIISRDEVKIRCRKSTLLWLIIGHEINHIQAIPLKIYEYIGARRPIINFAPPNSEATRIVNSYKLGWNFETTEDDSAVANKEQFYEIIGQYKNNSLDALLPVASLGNFMKTNQIHEFEKIIEM